MAERGGALGHDAALAELTAWYRDGSAGGVLLLTGPVRAAKAALLDELTARLPAPWLRVTAEGRVLAASGDPDEALAAVERRATAIFPVTADGGGPALLAVDDLRGVQEGGGRLAAMLGTIVNAALRDGWDGPRIVAGVDAVPPPLAGLPAIEPAHVQSRQRALAEVAGWVRDRDAPPVLLVRGRPGAGKTFFLREAARHLASLPDMRPAYVALRDGASGDPGPPLHMPGVVAGFIDAFARQGLVFGTPDGGKLVVDVRVGTVHPGARVTGIERVEVAPSLHTYGNLAVALEQRAAGGWADPALVLVVDGLNELEAELPGELAALRMFLQHRREFPAWNLKVVLSSQFVPDWLRGRVLDLDDHGGDVREFAGAVLAGRGLADADAVADQVARLADGLFIVADGYLGELAADPSLAGRLADETPAGGAAGYFADALRRVGDSVAGTAREQDWLDFQRLLTIAAITGPGPTAEEAAAIWQTPLEDRLPPPTSRDWSVVAERSTGSAARGYLRFPEGAGGRYRVFHATLREAIERRTPAHEGMSPAAERRRFLRALTPLHPGGRPWDPVRGRLALSETVTVLGDLLAGPSRDEARAALKLLLETWTWLETCVAHADPSDELPLGVDVALARLARLPHVPDLALWDGAEPRALPVRRREAADGPPKHRRRGRGLAYPDRDPELRKVLGGRSVHRRRADAEKVVAGFRERYQFSAQAVDEKNPDRRAMWIRGFGLTREEIAQGYTGNLAWIDVLRHGRSSWRVVARKLAAPLSLHPTTPKLHYDSPNWSVYPLPVTESSIKPFSTPPKTFPTRGDAERAVREFIAKYPKTGRVWGRRFGIIVLEGGRRPRKILLTVVQRPDGRFVIRAEPNPHAGTGKDGRA